MVNVLFIMVLILHLMQILSRIDELICLHYRWQCEDYRIVCGWNICTVILEGIILFNDNILHNIYNSVSLREYHS